MIVLVLELAKLFLIDMVEAIADQIVEHWGEAKRRVKRHKRRKRG